MEHPMLRHTQSLLTLERTRLQFQLMKILFMAVMAMLIFNFKAGTMEQSTLPEL